MENKTGITIRGGNVTRLGLLSRVLDLTDKLTSKELRGEYTYGGYIERPFKNGEIEAIAGVYEAVANTVATINTNGQNIAVTNCCFTGMNTGMKIEQSPDDNIQEDVEEFEVENNESNEDNEETLVETTEVEGNIQEE